MASGMRTVSGLTAVALSAVAMVGVAADAMTMAAYFDSKKVGGVDWANTEIFLTGVANGLTAANLELASNNKKQLFCAPTIPLNFDNVNDILEKEYAARRAIWNPTSPMRDVLLVGFMKAFPCK
jgi:hypothetical protein